MAMTSGEGFTRCNSFMLKRTPFPWWKKPQRSESTIAHVSATCCSKVIYQKSICSHLPPKKTTTEQTAWKINMEPKNGVFFFQMSFLFNRVIFRLQPLSFRGICNLNQKTNFLTSPWVPWIVSFFFSHHHPFHHPMTHDQGSGSGISPVNRCVFNMASLMCCGFNLKMSRIQYLGSMEFHLHPWKFSSLGYVP